MAVAMREDTLRALADLAGECDDRGIDAWTALDHLGVAKRWGPRKAWRPDQLSEGVELLRRLLVGEDRHVDPDPGDAMAVENDRLQRADDTIDTLLADGRLKPASTIPFPDRPDDQRREPQQDLKAEIDLCEERGGDARAALRRIAGQYGWSDRTSEWDADQLKRAADFVRMVGYVNGLPPADRPPEDAAKVARQAATREQRKLEPPPADRVKGRYPWLMAVGEHFNLNFLGSLDDWHKRRGEPTRTDEWDDEQYARAILWVEHKAMALPAYQDEFGPRPDGQAMMGRFLEDATRLASWSYEVAAPTQDHLIAVVDRLWREAVAEGPAEGCPIPAERLLPMLESLAKSNSLLALRLAARQAAREVAEIMQIIRTGGPRT